MRWVHTEEADADGRCQNRLGDFDRSDFGEVGLQLLEVGCEGFTDIARMGLLLESCRRGSGGDNRLWADSW